MQKTEIRPGSFFLAAESPLFKELATRKSVQRGVPLAAEDRKSPVKNTGHRKMPCIFICTQKSDQEAAFLAAESPLFKELATRKSVQRGVPLAAEDRKSPVEK